MSFNSIDYIVFLALVLTLYWQLPHRWQNLLLLAASYLFYGYIHPWFLALIFGTTAANYLCGLAMARYPQRKSPSSSPAWP